MSRPLASSRVLVALLAAMATAGAHRVLSLCGTTQDTAQQTQFLHRQAQRARAARQHPLDTVTPARNRDIGDIAIVEDANGVVERQNQFNLDLNGITFTPSANAYQYSVAPQAYDATAADGAPLVALDDDDARSVNLPFAFPFFGSSYTQLFVNSDGNLTFGAAEFASTERSLGRMTAGPPRIAPLFDDLDPSKTSGGVRVLAGANRVVVSWVNVPEYSSSGAGIPVTFQVSLFPDGRIVFAYNGVSSAIAGAVVGIAPGHLQGGTAIVDFRRDPSDTYSGAVVERFGNSLAIDIVTAAQQFYQTHDDAYDYLVIYNNMNIQAQGDAVAYENTVRSSGSGYNVPVQDSGALYGSPSRLHAILNMGQLTEYPVDPNAVVPARFTAGDTPLTVLAHEAGHLFLAYASVKDPANPNSQPMLGYQLAHWNFAYDSEASLLEGERLVDRGTSASPRFLTTDTVQGYSPLDQYLMGFRPASQVPDTFVVTDVHLNGYAVDTSQLHPIRNVAFDGTRLDVTAANVIQAQGRRTPDDTVAQRRFRFAFILVVPQGSTPSADDVAQVDNYRRQFEAFYAQASSGNGTADASLKRALQLSLSPAAGVVAGGGLATGVITVQTPPVSDLSVQLQSTGPYAGLPPSVVVPAGAGSATFLYSGLQAGVAEIVALPADPAYETASARLQVADASLLNLTAISGDQQVPASVFDALPSPVVVRLTDANKLAYPGTRVAATPSAGGSVIPAVAVTDAQGQAAFTWTPGAGPSNQLQLSVIGAPSVGLTVRAGKAVPSISSVGNAASYATGIAPGSLATLSGQNLAAGLSATANAPWPSTLAGVQVLLNGAPVPLLYVSDTQINFFVPASLPTGSATLAVNQASGTADTVRVNVVALQPGIFPGAILHAGSAASAVTTPVQAGDYIEIYCTGLGSTKTSGGFEVTTVNPTVFLGATPVQAVYSGLAPGFVGLYQVDVRVPAGLAPGSQPVILEIGLQHSNVVDILVR